MKILAVSDWIDPLIYSKSLKKRMQDVDVVISCGDLSASYLDYIMSILDKPVYYVVGNHIKRKYYKKSNSGATILKYPSCFTNLHGRIKHYSGMIICGFQGSHWYNGGPFQYRQWEVYLHLFKLVPGLILNRILYGRFVDVFVTHAPPYGVGDAKDTCHTGLKAFNLFLKLFKPRLMLHGHVHIYDRNEKRTKWFHNTKIINCTGFITAEIDISEKCDTILDTGQSKPAPNSNTRITKRKKIKKGGIKHENE